MFLRVPFLTFLASHTRKRCGQVGPTPCYSQSQDVSACQSFRPVAPFFFLAEVEIFGFFFIIIFLFYYFLNRERGVAT